MTELTRFEYTRALNHAHEDPESYKIIETLIGEHLTMVNHMKHTSLWDVMTYEENLTNLLKNPMEMLMYDNEKLKKEVNKLRKQLGMIEKYKIQEGECLPLEVPEPIKRSRATHLDDLDLGVRAHNLLWRAGKTDISDILRMSYREIIQLRGMGPKSYAEIITCLENEGFDCSNLKPKEED